MSAAKLGTIKSFVFRNVFLGPVISDLCSHHTILQQKRYFLFTMYGIQASGNQLRRKNTGKSLSNEGKSKYEKYIKLNK